MHPGVGPAANEEEPVADPRGVGGLAGSSGEADDEPVEQLQHERAPAVLDFDHRHPPGRRGHGADDLELAAVPVELTVPEELTQADHGLGTVNLALHAPAQSFEGDSAEGPEGLAPFHFDRGDPGSSRLLAR